MPSYDLKTLRIALLLILCIAGTEILAAQEHVHKEIPRGNEKEISVTVDVSFGKVLILRGRSSKVLEADYYYKEGRSEDFKVDYDIRGVKGILTIRSKERSRFWSDSNDEEIKDREWVLKLTDAVPLSLKIELGAGKGEFDFSGLQMKNLKISSGASAIDMSCDKQNTIEAESIIIESGVSKFTATNLNNINFRTLKFSGGVGAYRLDFGGKLQQSAEAKIEVGLGAVTIYVPTDLQVRLIYDDSWFSSFDLDDGFNRKRGGVYETEGYRQAERSISIEIESGLGSVKVRRKD